MDSDLEGLPNKNHQSLHPESGLGDDAPCALTNNAVFLLVLQVADGDKVALHHGHVAAVLAGDDGGLAVQRHLVVVLHRRVLLVGDLQGALGDVVDLDAGREGAALARDGRLNATSGAPAPRLRETSKRWQTVVMVVSCLL